MGIGDELIASGQAKQMHAKDGRSVYIVDGTGAGRWHRMWEGVSYIVHPATPRITDTEVQRLMNYPGHRPYISTKHHSRWVWQDFECTPADIVFNEAELVVGERFRDLVIIEPNTKSKASPNKDWGWARWEALVSLLRANGVYAVQLGNPSERPKLIQGVELVPTTDFRYAAAVLARARGAALPEGGLHHAAAAVGCPSVVIFGGFISPKQTGYSTQVNLVGTRDPCGFRLQCPHCEKALASITPERVAQELLRILR